jgi:hypothetical protein
VSAAAVMRAADAMLRALGADAVNLVLPAVAMPDDPSAQLGMVDPGVQEVRFYPVVARSLATSNSGPRRRMEFLLSGRTVADTVVEQNAASAQALFDSALGLLHDGTMFHIEGIVTDYFAGMAYLYRVTAVE